MYVTRGCGRNRDASQSKNGSFDNRDALGGKSNRIMISQPWNGILTTTWHWMGRRYKHLILLTDNEPAVMREFKLSRVFCFRVSWLH